LLAPAAGAFAAGAALAAGAGVAGFLTWPLTIEVPSSITAIIPGKYRCAFMEFSF
jgi:hypothetical protein